MSGANRRDFCKGLAAASMMTSMRGMASRTDSELPNIVYVLADDLGWGDLECNNPHSAIPTPNLKRLAEQGMRWNDMHASDAVCTPSRYGILTGRYCWRTRLKRGVLEGSSPDLIGDRATVASLLKSAGYYTAGVGKWHLGLGSLPKTDFTKPLRPGPIDHGFDNYYLGIPAALDMAPYLYFNDDQVVEQARNYTEGCEEGGNYSTRGVCWRPGPIAPHFNFEQATPMITNKAVEVIQERGSHPSQPFFLYVALPAVHEPWVPLAEDVGRSRAGPYGDFVAELDDMVGKMMGAVDKAGLADNTIFILTSDNGAEWGPVDLAHYEHRANGPWRGEKGDVWDGGHRIPFVIRWPGHIRPGSVSNELGCLCDLMATAAAITGQQLAPDAGVDSYNLLPILLGRNEGPVRNAIVYHSVDGMLGIQEGHWMLAEALGSGGWIEVPFARQFGPSHVDQAPRGPRGQLYDLATDPGQMYNVYQEHPDIVERLLKLLDTYKRQGYSRPM